MPLPLGTPGAGQPTTGVTVGDAVGNSAGIGFGLHEPPKMRKAMSNFDSGATTPTEPNPPDLMPGGNGEMSAPSSSGSSSGMSARSESSTPNNHYQARGTLNVKLISARGLAVSHSPNTQPQPYVVMQFEQNEFVSRPPHPVASPSSVPFTTAQAQPRGNLIRSTSGLGVGTITKAFAEAVGRGKGGRGGDGNGAQTPRAEEPPGGSSRSRKPGPGDPVWKEEVSL